MILSLVVLKRPKDFYQRRRLRLNKDGGLFQPWGRLGGQDVGGVVSLPWCISWLPHQGYLDVCGHRHSMKVLILMVSVTLDGLGLRAEVSSFYP